MSKFMTEAKQLGDLVRDNNQKKDYYNFDYDLLERINKLIDPEGYNGRHRSNYHRAQSNSPPPYNADLTTNFNVMRRFVKQGWAFQVGIDKYERCFANATNGDVTVSTMGKSPEQTVLELILRLINEE